MQPLPMYVNCDILDARQSGLHATNFSSQPNLIPSHPHPHLPPLTLPSTLPPLNISRVPPLHPDPDSPDTPSHQYENIAPGDVYSPGYLYSTTLHSFSLPPKPSPAPGVYNPPKSFPATGVYNPPSPLHSPPMSPGPISPLLDLCTPLNYIMLDLDKQDSGAQQTITNNGTKRPVVGYTTIDFNKTSALIKSSNNRFEDDEPGVRKTRHNSSISDISGAFRAQLSPTD
ncbi:proline-rich extensin-like protein EPR1 [Eurytemora carolleeae]|uniref:proline-rich extensin-like protein EPR1 n=1 Tax=Eurytemora carolleeae TaxID=1294199 RepID=UPI000C781BB0|nr:proline-rich extensin-like protein EPR1 [Eurytemora carolleeae]|eukprot:XP_023340657.1 proline-rich extensin-like protein EPR1 [Eurytemora affinis]